MPAVMEPFMQQALRLAKRAFGATCPNPLVGAVLVKGSRILGLGYHHRAGEAHAEVKALEDARRRGHARSIRGATLYVTLEPCSTRGRTPACTEAILEAGIRRVVIGAVDPNPQHQGKGLQLLKNAGTEVHSGILEPECRELNEPFNHWIVTGRPWVTVKAAMTLDGKIATADGSSKWITSPKSRRFAMRLRQGTDAILVGIETVLRDDSKLTIRGRFRKKPRGLRRIVLDSRARIPLNAAILQEQDIYPTTIVVSAEAPKRRIAKLNPLVTVWQDPSPGRQIDLDWLTDKLGAEQVQSLLVEGGGIVQGYFIAERLAHRVAFFYAPKILGGQNSRQAVAGPTAKATRSECPMPTQLEDVKWRRIGPDLLLIARITPKQN